MRGEQKSELLEYCVHTVSPLWVYGHLTLQAVPKFPGKAWHCGNPSMASSTASEVAMDQAAPETDQLASKSVLKPVCRCIENGRADDTSYDISASIVELYNEQVRHTAHSYISCRMKPSRSANQCYSAGRCK